MSFGTNLILVTGGSGWLGRAVLHGLAHGLADVERFREPTSGLNIRVLVLPGEDAGPIRAISPQVDIVNGDLRNPGDCARFCGDAAGAVLMHLAGMIHPRRVAEFYAVNVRGVQNIIDAAVAAKVRRAVVVSSNSPCGCNPHPNHLFDEDAPYHPYLHYGRSKMLMELAVKERQRTGEFEAVILRAPWFYGPFQPPRQTLFFRMIRDGKMPIVGGGAHRRSMAYVDNLCQGIFLATACPHASGETFWIADRRPYSMNEIVETVEQLLENEFGIPCRHKRIRLPGLFSEVAYFADKTIQSFGFYHQKLHVLSEMNKTIACSIDKARAVLEYEPAVELREGMRRSIAWVLDTQGAI